MFCLAQFFLSFSHKKELIFDSDLVFSAHVVNLFNKQLQYVGTINLKARWRRRSRAFMFKKRAWVARFKLYCVGFPFISGNVKQIYVRTHYL